MRAERTYIVCISHHGTSLDALNFTHIVYHRLRNRRQEVVSSLRMTLTYSSCSQGFDLSGDSEQGHESEDAVRLSVSAHLGMIPWSCVVHQYQDAEPSRIASPQIQHSTIIDPSLQLTARFVPNQFLSPSSPPLSLSLHSPFFIFHITPMCPPLTPSLPGSYLTP